MFITGLLGVHYLGLFNSDIVALLDLSLDALSHGSHKLLLRELILVVFVFIVEVIVGVDIVGDD